MEVARGGVCVERVSGLLSDFFPSDSALSRDVKVVFLLAFHLDAVKVSRSRTTSDPGRGWCWSGWWFILVWDRGVQRAG